jgi:hypothetical protein
MTADQHRVNGFHAHVVTTIAHTAYFTRCHAKARHGGEKRAWSAMAERIQRRCLDELGCTDWKIQERYGRSPYTDVHFREVKP